MLGIGPIPVSPPDVALGIPCDLLRRRPDVRSAERLAAAQAEAIGIAEADLYPSFFINGSLGYSAQFFPICSATPPSPAVSGRRSSGTC